MVEENYQLLLLICILNKVYTAQKQHDAYLNGIKICFF